ncbi:sterol carrier protein domain-containing protein, partial [Jeotgalibaca porci]
VDVEAFLKLYPFVELEETLYVKVNDSQAEWNDAFFQIDLDGSVEKVLDAPGDKILEMDIGAFSTLMVGFHGIDWYERNGQAKVAPLLVPVWRKALAAGYPSINENF